MKFILGKKLDMSQMFDEVGNLIPVTLILAGPCEVTQLKSEEKDGYSSIQVGFEKIEKPKKSQQTKPFKFLREFRTDKEFKIGDLIDVSVFETGGKVQVAGITKGKGFQGGVKRYGFAGQKATRGAKHEHRTLGSTGSRYPQRVVKGRKMAGRMGGERRTVKNLTVLKIDKDNNLLVLKGATPGNKGALLIIKEITQL